MLADLRKGSIRAKAEILFLITHIFKAVIATGLKPGMTILRSLHYTRRKFHATPLLVWAWVSRVSHMVENRPFYVLLWSSTTLGKNIATLSNI